MRRPRVFRRGVPVHYGISRFHPARAHVPHCLIPACPCSNVDPPPQLPASCRRARPVPEDQSGCGGEAGGHGVERALAALVRLNGAAARRRRSIDATMWEPSSEPASYRNTPSASHWMSLRCLRFGPRSDRMRPTSELLARGVAASLALCSHKRPGLVEDGQRFYV